jgi:hypothetical protein
MLHYPTVFLQKNILLIKKLENLFCMPNKEIFYHGSCYLFNQFSLSLLGKGEGKSKFGHGIYITSSYQTATLYASKAAKANNIADCYVYTVEVPALTLDNHLFSCNAVNPTLAKQVEDALGEKFPEKLPFPSEVKSKGKYFRKYLGNLLINNIGTVKQMINKTNAEAEMAVSEFLNNMGVIFLAWPQCQSKPNGDTNRAVLNVDDIKILKVEKV